MEVLFPTLQEVRSRECSVESDPGFSVLFLCKFNINVNWFLWQNVASTKNRGSVTSLQHKSKNTLYPFGPTKVQNDHFDSFGRSKHPYTRYSVCDFSAKDRTEDRTIFHLLQTNPNCSIIMTPPLCSFIRRDESPPYFLWRIDKKKKERRPKKRTEKDVSIFKLMISVHCTVFSCEEKCRKKSARLKNPWKTRKLIWVTWLSH